MIKCYNYWAYATVATTTVIKVSQGKLHTEVEYLEL